MAKSPEQMLESMKQGLLEKTGKPLDHWTDLVRKSGLEKFGDQMKLLKTEHGLTHGYANLACQAAKGRLDANEGDMLANQYSGKESLRPIFDALAAHAGALGKDVEIAPKKTSVAFRRSKNFAVVTPATKTRVDLGLNLKGTPGTNRLLEEKPGGMCTHKVRLTSVTDVDAELKAWLAEAYTKA
ncbi:DUF5655 domain-containing protein [Hyphomonas sp. UBA4494]|jgi:predicted transport protein|uniref:DUF5655 domain-containing protein n=1 Tax=Hyphomonas sp. UBA4494 TaxID=1946631 RepID=UPI0025C0B994|nr:DUF5655 domain-containing protein [Hyphomonas sp. UBA4494]